MREKERGRRKRTARAKKWREWALTMRLVSDSTPQRFRLWVDMIGDLSVRERKGRERREREAKRFREDDRTERSIGVGDFVQLCTAQLSFFFFFFSIFFILIYITNGAIICMHDELFLILIKENINLYFFFYASFSQLSSLIIVIPSCFNELSTFYVLFFWVDYQHP